MSKRNRHNMPENFEPPVAAWAAEWAGQAAVLTTVIFAIQGQMNESFRQWLSFALNDVEYKPEWFEKAKFKDREGIENTVFVAYWRDGNYQRWWGNDRVSAWWQSDDRLNEAVGYWREHYDMPIERLETLHSSPRTHGVARLAPDLEGPIDEHAYPGAARDRISVSGSENVASNNSLGAKLKSTRSQEGKRVHVTPPANLCVIRSGQDWGQCAEEEASFYLEKVHPTLILGMDYLANNPEESRCLSMRLMQNIDEDGLKLSQTFGLGYALDIFAFEEWAKSHPTHLDIFAGFMVHAGKFQERMKLSLWHEISVLAEHGGQFEYINCHPKTGLLPYC